MFKVYRNGKYMKSLGLFFSYEEARAAVRSFIRRQVKAGKLNKEDFGYFDQVSRNPSNITAAGFRIKVAA